MDIQKAGEQALVAIDDQSETFDLLVVFQLMDQEYGLMASKVREIIRNRPTTRVPNAGVIIDGVINLRGRIVPVFNMRRRLSLPETDTVDRDKLTVMVVESGGSDAGLLVDRVTDVTKIESSSIDLTISSIKGLYGKQYVEGTVDLDGRLVTLLKLEELLAKTD